jgi:4-hydroxybenzoate polyprenyltransferase
MNARSARAGGARTRRTYDAAMASAVRRVFAAIEVSRLPVAFGAVANVWLMLLLARVEAASPQPDAVAESTARIASLPTALLLGASAAFAVGFMVFGAALNDILDAKRDGAFAPDRPIPSGSLSTRRAMHMAALALVTGLVGAIPFGPASMVGAAILAVIVIAYDAFAKFVPAVGIVLAGLATAASMLALRLETTMPIPIWLAMSQTMGISLLAYILSDKRPKLSRRAVALGALGWTFWSSALFLLAAYRNDGALFPKWFAPSALTAPILTLVACALFGLWKLRSVRGPRAGEKLLRYATLWKALVAAGWLLAAGLVTEAAWVGGLAIAIALLFAALRELAPQLAVPVGWRS